MKAICKNSKRFCIGKQEDAHELLMYFIDIIHEETKVEYKNELTKSSLKNDKIQELNPDLLTGSQDFTTDNRVFFLFVGKLNPLGKKFLGRFYEQE